MSGNQQDPDMICEVFVLAANDVLVYAWRPSASSFRT